MLAEWGGADSGGAEERGGEQPGAEAAPVPRQQPEERGGPVPGQGQEGTTGQSRSQDTACKSVLNLNKLNS
jgi:hypothetical protein